MMAKTLLTVLLIALLAILLVAVAIGASPLTPSSLLVIPGVGIEKVRLGMTQQQVFNTLGLPVEIERDFSDIYWTYEVREVDGSLSNIIVSWSRRDDRGVDFIFTNSRRATAGGVVAGDSLARVFERYGVPDELDPWGRRILMTYNSKGVRFVIVEGTVFAFIVVPKK